MLATDGEETYVLFLYRDMQWGEGSVVGFNAGDGKRGFMLPGDVRTLESRSNVGPDFPGVWMFRVDQQIVLQPREGMELASSPDSIKIKIFNLEPGIFCTLCQLELTSIPG